MEKIAIFGGAGFIGSHLCHRLTESGFGVLCVDNLLTGRESNIASLKNSNNFRFIEHDITTPFEKETEEELKSCRIFYNLASPASPHDYTKLPLQTLWVNAAGTRNLLHIAAKNNIVFVQASTSEVYGDPLMHPQKEEYYGNVNPVGPRSCYDEGKRFAESLCFNYWNDFKFPLKIVRIFNTYGPLMRVNDGRVISEFIKNALTERPLKINGNGSQTRSFCYIDDMVEGLIKLAATPVDFTGPVNLGNPHEITIKNLAEIIIEMTNSKSAIINEKRSTDDPARRCPDISLAKKIIGFSPAVNLTEGLRKTIEYFKNIMN